MQMAVRASERYRDYVERERERDIDLSLSLYIYI